MIGLPQMTQDANGNCQYIFSSEHVKIWGGKGVIPQQLVGYFFEKLTKNQKEHLRLLEFRKENPGASQEEIMDFLGISRSSSPEEQEQIRKDIQMSLSFFEFLRGNWNMLVSSLEEENQNRRLFKNVVGNDKLGIARLIADPIYHLKELLENSVLNNLYENIYEASGTTKNTLGEKIGLIFSFSADSKEAAEKIFKNYKKIIAAKGLKIWMAHWEIANEVGRTEYSCSMTEVMKLLSEDDRRAHFSVKEKEEHWSITKILGMTKLSREQIFKKKNADVVRWVEQPLLEILGGEKKLKAGDKYPELITVRVLIPQSGMKGFVPAVYSKETYRLHPADVYLAFVIQTRASMRDRGEKELWLDWKGLFKLGNLEDTAQSNKRVAKVITRKKMDKLKQTEVIVGWNEETEGMRITPQSQNQKNKKLKGE